MRALRTAVLGLHLQAIEILLKHGVHDARDGVRAIDGGGAVQQNL